VKKIGLVAPRVLPPKLRSHLLRIGTALVLAVPAYAQAGASPWENAVSLFTAESGDEANARNLQPTSASAGRSTNGHGLGR
jgi:hypothetical protein